MLRKTALLLLAGVLAVVTAGCGAATVEPKIADTRILGEWYSSEGQITFYQDGSATVQSAQGGVNAMSETIPFEMPEKDRLLVKFKDGTRFFKVTITEKKSVRTQTVLETDKDWKPIDDKKVVYTLVGK